MPDSQLPPIWGSPYDERDLDALLSGETWSTPVALQPVEHTLDALRAAATSGELSDEAAARAAYRAVTLGSVPAAQQRSGVTEHTLVLPPGDGRLVPAVPSASATRHRHRRRPVAAGPRRPRLAVTGAAAGALIVVAAVVTGALTGSIGELTSFVHQSASASPSSHATGRSASSQGVMASGAARDPNVSPTPPKPKHPTVPASPSPRPTPDPSTLCRQYFQDLQGFQDGMRSTPGGQAAWTTLVGELGQIADGQSKVYGYCYQRLFGPFMGKSGGPATGDSAGASVGGPGSAGGAGSVGGAGSAGGAGSVGGAASAGGSGAAANVGSVGNSGTEGGAGSARIAGTQGGATTEQGQRDEPVAAAGRP